MRRRGWRERRGPGLEVLEEVAPGVGGMGKVYRALDKTLDRIVAIKTVRAHLCTDAGLEYFQREARAAGGLDRPNIVKIYSFVPDHAPPYYVMQFVRGSPLSESCQERGFDYLAGAIAQVADALAYAHKEGVIHRDIKPSNILCDEAGRAPLFRHPVCGRLLVHPVWGLPRDALPALHSSRPQEQPSS